MTEPLTLTTFFDLWPLFREAALTGAIAGALLGMLGVYIVLRRLVFLSAAVSQAASLGVALAFYARLHLGATGLLAGATLGPTLGATLLTLLAITLIITGSRAAPAHRDSLLGLVWLLGSAGTLAIGTRIAQDITDIDTLLFGSAVAVIPEDFTLILTLAAAIGALHLCTWRGFAATTFDPDGARVRGLPVHLLDATLFITLALAISICTRVIGALPTFAFSVLPALAALRLAPTLPTALALATLLGATCGFGGYLLASLHDLPVGAAQTLTGIALATLAATLAATLDRLRRSKP